MSDSLKLVGLLFIESIPTIIFVVILVAILDRLFFRPVAAVIKKRADATVGALARARQQASEAAEKSGQYERELTSARAEIFRQRQADHQAAQAELDRQMRHAREHSERLISEANQALSAEVATARRQLASTSQSLANEIAAKILGTSRDGEDRAA